MRSSFSTLQGLKTGHFSDHQKGTGLSVFLFPSAATGAYTLCGAAPASHELAPLNPDASVAHLHALVFTGGSAFGLYAAEGVMRFLAQRHTGLVLPHGVVPVVPAVAIYDLGYKQAHPPCAADAFQACLTATEKHLLSDRQVGAGTGATVGKLIPGARCMTGGLGHAAITLPCGVQVTAFAVVNAGGDVLDSTSNIIAGAQWEDGTFVNTTQWLCTHSPPPAFFQCTNTTLVAVFTNAKFSRTELMRISRMAVAGMARAISPLFTCYDGDILFAISVGEQKASVLTTGVAAAEAVRLAIVDAVHTSVVVT